jgi:flagellar biosynthesis protein FliR
MLLPFWEGNAFVVTRMMIALMCSLSFGFAVPDAAEFSIFAVLLELLFGGLLVLPLIIVLELIAGLGELFDAIRGQTLAGQYSMNGGAPEGVSSFGLKSFVWLLLLLSGVFEQLLLSVAESFRVLPVGSLMLQNVGVLSRQLCKLFIYECTVLLQVFLPLAVLFILVEIFVAVLQIVLPNTSLQAETFIAKTLVGGLFLIGLVSMGAMNEVSNWVQYLLSINQLILLR